MITIRALAVLLLGTASLSRSVTLQSPDGNILVTIDVPSGVPTYSVNYQGAPVLLASRLGFTFSSGAPLGFSGGGTMSITSSSTATVDSTWIPVYGQWNSIRNHFNQLTVDLLETAAPNRQLRLVFRAYDEGVAFHYHLPTQSGLTNFTLTAENTEFRFTADHPLHAHRDRAQSLYDTLRLSQITAVKERPITILPSAGPFISLTEARMVDYSKTRFGPGGTLILRTAITGNVTATTPYSTPWRVIFLADRAVDLLNHQYLIENLNPPNAIQNTSWIKPGKAMRVTCSDETCARTYIDFAATRGLQYLHWDAGWYGPEGNAGSNATQVVWPINIANYIRDARARGLGLFLYVNQVALTSQLAQILPTYQSWGVSGIKYGFVTVGSQAATTWLHDAVRQTAAYNLMIDIHDEYVPTGFSRAYPHLLTQEGIGGDEIFPSPDQTLTFLYSRMLAGAADHTVCYFDGRVTGAAGWTRAYQLAKPVVFYGPLQFLFWYDTPARYNNEPELEFWRTMPTVWDDTRALQGDVGSHIVMARRSGNDWYLGSITAPPRTVQIPLSFLNPSLWYMAHIYVNGSTPAQVRIAHYLVHSGFSLNAILQRAGGQAVRLTPATAQEIQTYRGQRPAGWQNDIAVYPDTDPTAMDPDRMRKLYAEGFKARTVGSGRTGLSLPPGTRGWRVMSLFGRRIFTGGGSDHADLYGLTPGIYWAEALTPAGRARIRFVAGK